MKDISSLFDRIAPVYDQMNTVMSFGQDAYWRKCLVARFPWDPEQKLTVVDMSCGTGALTKSVLQEASLRNQSMDCWMIDPSKSMLNQSQLHTSSIVSVYKIQAWAEDVPLACDHVDVYICGFGLRNMENRFKALQEAYRIVRPGGVVLMLEFSTEVTPTMAWAYRQYLTRGIPILGRHLAQDEAAYQYLSDSIQNFPSSAIISSEFSQAGFEKIVSIPITFGIVQLYHAVRPKSEHCEGEIVCL